MERHVARRAPLDPRSIICDGTVRRIRYYFNWNPFDWRLHCCHRRAPARVWRRLQKPILISEGIFNSQSRERSAATKIMVSRHPPPPPLPPLLRSAWNGKLIPRNEAAGSKSMEIVTENEMIRFRQPARQSFANLSRASTTLLILSLRKKFCSSKPEPLRHFAMHSSD